ncbi:MAG: HD domain-containing protein [Thermodesulfobacteriota bacterium]|nr:HD domain-containing protein [Thermodesulfobacteriota bacterium]
MAPKTGTIILNGLPNREIREKVVAFLSHHVKNLTAEKITTILDKTPVILNRDTPSETGKPLVDKLNDLGASASFVPNISREEKSRSIPMEKEIKKPDSSAAHQLSSPTQIKAHVNRQDQLLAAGINKQKVTDDRFRFNFLDRLMEANKELWLILSMVVIAGLINYAVASQYLLLGLYTLPTIMSAYFFGRRHAVSTALASILLVVLVVHFNPDLFAEKMVAQMGVSRWYHILSWACILIVIAYAMGTLYKKNRDKVIELRQTYQGLLVILRHFISKDEYTENHCYRVSVYASKIAAYMGLSDDYIEDIRSAALLHDLGKLEVSRRILYKAARLTPEEKHEMERHVNKELFDPIQGPLGRIIPLILGHHDRFDGSGYRPTVGKDIPLGARILAVADVYDALVSDRPYRKAMSPFEAKDIIVKGAEKDFDSQVVKAFVTAFDRRDLEVPNVII